MAATRKLTCTLVPMIQLPDEITVRHKDVLHIEENAARNCDEAIINTEEGAVVKPEGSAWIDAETLEEISFQWQHLTSLNRPE